MTATEQQGQTLGEARRPQAGGRLLGRITRQSRFYWVRLLLEKPVAAASILFVLFMVVATLVAPSLLPHDPFFINPVVRLQEPSSEYWLGTDQLGRDVLVRGIYGARTSLLVGVAVMFLSAFVGSVIGLIAGYYPRVDTPIMRVMDGIMAFPSILLAIAIMASLGPDTRNVVIALGLVYMPTIARLVRGQTLSIRGQPYVEAAQSLGQRDHIILGRHIFLNSLSPLIVQCTFVVAFAILAEASLSFLGAGVPPDVPTWGRMLSDGQQVITRAWWVSVVPGTLLFLTVLALNLTGDSLRDALDPRARTR